MKVRLTNFRCFKDTGPIGLRKVNFLVGENGSGKSAFLEGVASLFGLAHGKPVRLTSRPFDLGGFQEIVRRVGKGGTSRCRRFGQELATGHGRYKWEFRERNGDAILSRMSVDRSNSWETFVFNHDAETKTARITKHLSDYEVKQLEEYGVKLRALRDPFERSYSSPFAFTVKGVEPAFDDLHIMDFESLAQSLAVAAVRNFEASESDIKLDEWKHYGIRSVFGCMFLGIDNNFLKEQPQCIPISAMRFQPRRLYAATDEVAASFGPERVGLPERFMQVGHMGSALLRERENLVSDFGVKSGLFRKFWVESLADSSPYPFALMVETPEGCKRNVVDLGQGASLLSHLICELLLFDDRRCYLIQQPETGLAANAQAELASLFAKTAGNDCRFLIETHSEHVLDRMKREVETGGISRKDVGILFFERTPVGTNLFKLDVDKRGAAIDPPDSYRALFPAERNRGWRRVMR